MKNIRIFLNWLSKHNLLKSFIHNWEEFHSKKFTSKLYLQHCSRNPKYWVDDAFCWAESSEGYDFWEQYHYEWQHFCQHSSDFKETKIAISIY